ncbi:MAG: transcriptional repressor [Anaerolineaceae bacterium]|nr:transcriptional repressor [Anaerolineaceae bacterium]
MINSDSRFNQLISALKERNFRLTPQRMELVRLIAASEGHPSANQFYEQIKLKFPTMSHATVYKTLAMLKEMDQVFEINLREDSHYDGNRPEPHPHLICIKCNKIIDGDISLDQKSVKELEQETGYTVLRPQITLYGLCPDCRNER